MARDKKGKGEDSGNLIELASLGEDMAKLARHLGYRERCSVNNVSRQREHEHVWEGRSRRAAGILAVLAVAFAGIAFVVDEDRRSALLGVGGFVALWVVMALMYARRAAKRAHELDLLEKAVREKTGR